MDEEEKANVMNTAVERFENWNKYKKERAENRVAEAQKKKEENENLTFKPKINGHSAKCKRQPHNQPKGLDKYLARVQASKALKDEKTQKEAKVFTSGKNWTRE